MRLGTSSAAGLVAVLLTCAGATAGDWDGWSVYGGGAFAYGAFTGGDPGGVQPNLEIRAPSIGQPGWLGDVHPTVGLTVATESDQVTNLYAGFTADLLQSGPVSLQGQLGLAVHDGDLDEGPGVRQALGCRVLAHLGIAVDWRINETWSAQLYADHMSNAKLCDDNDGYETTGVRLGYHF
jgi:lipid A 3-O-deacylase